jgi:alpha-tubulin suppressor-like RCC1 family protein
MVDCGFWTSNKGQSEICAAIVAGNFIWSTGYNTDGQLGTGDTTALSVFTRMTDDDIQWKDSAAGSDFSVMISLDGRLFGCGNTYSDALGKIGVDNGYVDVVDPTQLSTDENWSHCSAGDYHSVFVKEDGTLWGSGSNGYGALGLGSTTYVEDFTQIGADTDWAAVHCGKNFTVAIKTNGTIWATGDNGQGQLGVGDYTSRDVFTQVNTPTGQTWLNLSTGDYHCCAVRSDGTLWLWGDQVYGQLGNGIASGLGESSPFLLGSDTEWGDAACGEACTFAVKDDGLLYVVGQNNNGDLATGDTSDYTVFTSSFGGLPVSSVDTANGHTLIADSSDTLWVCGRNNRGQLGISPLDYDVHHPTAIGIIDCQKVTAGISFSLILV